VAVPVVVGQLSLVRVVVVVGDPVVVAVLVLVLDVRMVVLGMGVLVHQVVVGVLMGVWLLVRVLLSHGCAPRSVDVDPSRPG
jgi:hypothetical protein